MSEVKSHKLIADNHDHFVVQHSDGTEMKIAKHDMDPFTHQKISKLEKVENYNCGGSVQKFADGGEMLPERTPESMQPSPADLELRAQREAQTAKDDAAAAVAKEQRETGIMKPEKAQQNLAQEKVVENTSKEITPSQPSPVASEPQAAQPDPLQVEKSAQNKNITAFQDKIKSFADSEANAFSQAGHAYNEFVQKMDKLKSPIDVMNEHKVSDDALVKQYMDSKVDPDRIYKTGSLSGTGNKILAGLATIIGGIGAGLTGGKNEGLEAINRAVERDIEAQRNDQSKNLTLYKMNRQKYEDENAAIAATKNQYLNVAEAKAKVAMAKVQNPEAQLRLQQTIFDLQNQKEKNNQIIANMSGGKQNGNMMGLSNSDPSMLVNEMVPKEHQKEVFNEIKTAQNTQKMGKSIMQAFEEANKENTIVKTGAGMLRTPGSVLALHQHMQPTFQDLEGTVRQAAMDNTFKNVTPMPGDSDHTINQKRNALKEYLLSKSSAPTAKGFGIDLSKYSSTSSDPRARFNPEQGMAYKTAMERLRINPMDEKSHIVLKTLGLD